VSDRVKLDISIADYPHTRKLISGEIPIKGVEANFIEVKPQIGAFRRMVRDVEFDVCELAPTTYIIARAFNSARRHRRAECETGRGGVGGLSLGPVAQGDFRADLCFLSARASF